MTGTLASGDIAADFALPDAEGHIRTLAEFSGKTLVLYFYPKADTSGCTVEAKDFTALVGEFANVGSVIVGVSPDAPKALKKFSEKHALGITLLGDESKAMLEAYGVWVQKSMYGRSYMGVERTTFLIGADGRIKQVWRKVKIPSHAAAVLAAARAG